MERSKRGMSLWTMLRGVVGASPIPRLQLRFPGTSHAGPLPPVTPDEAALAGALRRDVEALATDYRARNWFHPDVYARARAFLAGRLRACGLTPREQTYVVEGVECANIIAEIPGSSRPSEIIVVGAHYDSIELRSGPCPAANDNASGVACTLALAAYFGAPGPPARAPGRTLRFVLYANEEPPWFWTEAMGSLVHARSCRAAGENIVAMLTPETLGHYTDEPGSQRYPPLLSRYYPKVGNFVSFVGLHESRALVARCVETFRRTTPFPCEGAAVPAIIPRAGASDHWSYWKCGYPGLMVTDTAPLRYRHYHTQQDTPDKIDFERFARVTGGLVRAVEELAGGSVG
ncbi:MAG: M28 family peptidase [Planctomycetota bacterium]|nr:M28 family peptidase [Planctomycetota bacterium]